MRQRLTRLIFPILIAMIFIRCSDIMVFNSEQDDRVMAAVVGTKQVDQLVVTIREDLEAAAAAQHEIDDNATCQVLHVVRANGLGRNEERDISELVGCGGCPFLTAAYIELAIESPEGIISSKAELVVGDHYQPPYTFFIDDPGVLVAQGQIDGNGRLTFSRYEPATL